MYTYSDFENKAKELGLSGQISEYDRQLAKNNPDAGVAILEAKNEWNTATTDEARALANAKAESVRQNIGTYTAGTDGSKFNYKVNTPSSFTSDEGLKAEEKLNEYMNYQPFSYDPEKDSVYSAYKKAYEREGKRASEDTMAQAATMTGGIPSSYAITASQQAGNYYASQLADKIPELEAKAYDRYQQEKSDLVKAYELLTAADGTKYNRHLDQIGYEQGEREYKDTKTQQELENQWYEEEVKREIDNTEYNKNLDKAELGIKVGDYSPLENFKLTPDLKKLNDEEDDGISVFASLRKEYGDKIPGAIWDSYDLPTQQALVSSGFTRALDNNSLVKLRYAYGTGVIPIEDWNQLLSEGVSEEDLHNAGFYNENE